MSESRTRADRRPQSPTLTPAVSREMTPTVSKLNPNSPLLKEKAPDDYYRKGA